MGMIDALIPLFGGLYVLLVPLRKKSPDEPQEEFAKRNMQKRMVGVGLMVVAAAYFGIKQMTPAPIAKVSAAESKLLAAPPHRR